MKNRHLDNKRTTVDDRTLSERSTGIDLSVPVLIIKRPVDLGASLRTLEVEMRMLDY